MYSNLRFSLLLILSIFVGSTSAVFAQNNATVFDPTQSTTYVTSSSQYPSVPANNNTVYKWVATKAVSWDASKYKAYIYNGMAFRLYYPKTYDPNNTTKKYPMLLFFHGAGEGAPVYNNEQQLFHGGQTLQQAVDAGTFDGFLLYPQSTGTGWYEPYYSTIASLIQVMVNNANVDQDRVNIHGLSNGGKGVWEFLSKYPTMVASAQPISAYGGDQSIPQFLQVPIWLSQGALDTNPSPGATEQLVTMIRNQGGNIRYTVYPNVGHGVWNLHWAEPDMIPFTNAGHKANPLVYFGHSEYCSSEPVTAKLGLTAGFDGYEWRKDGVTIAGATSNTLDVTAYGTYDARIKRGTQWSVWSPIPAVIKVKNATPPPTITTTGLASAVLPALDGATSTPLEVPDNYETYSWTKVGSNQVLATTRQYIATQTGQYVVTVKEKFGCANIASAPFTVVPANGTPAPSPAVTGLTATALSMTSVKLQWTDTNGETAYEIYRATTSGGPYKLAGLTNADVVAFNDTGLNANTPYYYVVRAINLNGAATASAEATATTVADTTPPTAPTNATIVYTTQNTIEVSWGPSTDNVGVTKYDIYVNDQKRNTVSQSVNSYVIQNLTPKNIYTIKIVARDFAGNTSAPSNTVTGVSAYQGFKYKYFETEYAWSTMPNFNQLTPVKTGVSANVNLNVANRNYSYGILWEGFIRIPVSGNYTFETNSDDGSMMYIGSYNPTAAPLVNNDGQHAMVYAQGTINLQAGYYPITVSFFQAGGGQGMELYWKNTAAGVVNRQLIPDSFFSDNMAATTVPTSPSTLTATKDTKGVNLKWKDNATNEVNYQVYRSKDNGTTFDMITLLPANTIAYSDTVIAGNYTYLYKVRAINAIGASGYSNTISILTNNRTPVLNPVGNLSVFAADIMNVPLTAVDNPLDVLTITGVNLPAFATLVTSGTGAVSLRLAPGVSQIGLYSNVGLTVTDNNGAASTINFNITVANKQTSTFFVNFNNGNNQGAPWNNFNKAPIANASLGNLTDDAGQPSTVTLSLQEDWNGANDLGVNTGNDSGVYPDNVMKSFYFDYSGNTKHLKLSGLNASKRYNFTFFASWANPWSNGTTTYTINGQSVTIDPTNNSTITRDILNIAPDSNNEINITVGPAPGAGFMFINALVVKASNFDGRPAMPTNLSASANGRTAIGLTWTDIADNETGFEIYRSTTLTGTYTLINTAPVNASSYNDTGLQANSTYYYKIRAIGGAAGNSDFTQPVGGGTLMYSVNINLSRQEPAPSPWNNTNQNPADGDTFINLVNDQNVNSGINMVMTKNFSGANNLGMIGSPLYPDVVSKWFYYLEKNETANVRFTGLNTTLSYDLVFYSSWKDAWANGVTSFTINGKTVTLDPLNNINNTISLNNVVPDENGEILLQVTMTAAAQYAIVNAITINAHSQAISTTSNNNLNLQLAPTAAQKVKMDGNMTMANNQYVLKIPVDGEEDLPRKKMAYPNPFVDKLSVDIGEIAKYKATVSMFSISGKMVYQNAFEANTSVYDITLPAGAGLSPGLYIVRVDVFNSPVKVFKVIKQ